eukprot:CAMPEP_0119535588 /NCGR_PEP_ID=MMETSP1344-20130328/48606_1 /TAXON_ID=236787 /ORGANISM="Florenciella parvula, Strain CCMP2471" /LENGTH=82 /DNA_ID=CAMNT_0007577285 /DNA_START=36 /DNA_END=280 /DNA_ORIENTATION=-
MPVSSIEPHASRTAESRRWAAAGVEGMAWRGWSGSGLGWGWVGLGWVAAEGEGLAISNSPQLQPSIAAPCTRPCPRQQSEVG